MPCMFRGHELVTAKREYLIKARTPTTKNGIEATSPACGMSHGRGRPCDSPD